MSAVFRSAIGLILVALLLAACTRERPVPVIQPITDTSVAETTGADTTPAGAQSATGEEPDVEAAGASTPGAVDPLGLDDEPEVTVEATAAASDAPETFAYTVRPGDTLLGLAQRFETNVDAIRRLNALDSESLSVGQPLIIPYIEGMTADGAPTPTPGPFYYTVAAGDTLSGIAARFNTDFVRLIEANSLLDPNNLVVGSQLLIPGHTAPSAAGDGATPGTTPVPGGETRFVHIVQPGEGLLEIAARYGVDMNTIATANNLANRNVLRVGQELVIPGLTARDAAIRSGAVHIVQSGDSLLGIALRYGVTVAEIMEFNEITDPNNIRLGQQLIIPRD